MGAISSEVELARHADEVAALSPSQQEIYATSIAQGSSPGFALMCAVRQPPGSRNTDRAFCQGARHQMEAMRPDIRDAIVKKAKAAGIQTDGKFYKGQLGRYTNPAAWVSCADDVIASCKAQNKGVEGVINVPVSRKVERPPPAVPLAPDIVRDIANNRLASDASLAEKIRRKPSALRELHEEIVDKHGKDRKPIPPVEASASERAARRRARVVKQLQRQKG